MTEPRRGAPGDPVVVGGGAPGDDVRVEVLPAVGGRIHRVADSVPAVPVAPPPDTPVAPAEARASPPEEGPLGGARLSVRRAVVLGARVGSSTQLSTVHPGLSLAENLPSFAARIRAPSAG